MLEQSTPQRAIITGAMSGIGRAAAELVLGSGGRVLGLDLSDRDWQAPGLTARTADITDPESLRRALSDAPELLGGAPDALIHCAGIYRFKSVLELSLEEWEHSMRVNGTGSFLAAQAAARVMTDGGSIVLFTSVAFARGDAGEPGSAYAASKGAVVSLTRQLAVELGPIGIRVNTIAPGVIKTPMTTIVHDASATATLTGRLPLQRLGEADEVAKASLFLASGAASYITGVVLPVDGGYLIS